MTVPTVPAFAVLLELEVAIAWPPAASAIAATPATKPYDAQLLVSVREVRIWQTVDIVAGAVVLGVAVERLHARVGLGAWLAFVLLLLLGGLMISTASG